MNIKTKNEENNIQIFCFSEMINTRYKNDDICNGLQPKKYLQVIYSDSTNSCLSSLKENGYIRSMGWAYDFRPHLKKYAYKVHNNWYECYAPNKLAVKTSTIGTVKEVLEIPVKKKRK